MGLGFIPSIRFLLSARLLYQDRYHTAAGVAAMKWKRHFHIHGHVADPRGRMYTTKIN